MVPTEREGGREGGEGEREGGPHQLPLGLTVTSSSPSLPLPLQLVPLGLFELHCDELTRTLSKRASDIISQLLNRMTQDNHKDNQQ